MSYLNFNKEALVNLEYSLGREILRSNRAGAYASYSLSGCNTRKYHGLLICPVEKLGGEHFVLLSGVDITLSRGTDSFNLAMHQYEGDIFSPRGHKYLQDFNWQKIPQELYRIGSIQLLRETILVDHENQIFIRYTLLESDKQLSMRLSPFLAYRNIHALSKANGHVNTDFAVVSNGIKTTMYSGFPAISIQLSKANTFHSNPDWYYNIEYTEERRRGYEYREDLYVPGSFEVTLKKGESLIFSASTGTPDPANFQSKFEEIKESRIISDSFQACLRNSARQFIQNHRKGTYIKAGYHWYNIRARDTFASLPGLTLACGDTTSFFQVADTMVATLKNGLFPDEAVPGQREYLSADASLWFIWALQQAYTTTGDAKGLWLRYSKAIKSILAAYQKGTQYNIFTADNGLLLTSEMGMALSWMNAKVYGTPVTPRSGYCVEINALWFNAVCFSLLLADAGKDANFARKWNKWPQRIANAFILHFWNEEKEYLCDYFQDQFTDWSIRPNQVIAAAMTYSPLNKDMKHSILETVRKHLLTPRGLRTLAPGTEEYRGHYSGNYEEREKAFQQGSAWPCLLEHYSEAYLNLYGKSGLSHVKQILSEFEPALREHGLGTISELYDGDPPYKPGGAISFAWSVASLLRIMEQIEKTE